MIGDDGAQLPNTVLGLIQCFHDNAKGWTSFPNGIESRTKIVHGSKAIQVRESLVNESVAFFCQNMGGFCREKLFQESRGRSRRRYALARPGESCLPGRVAYRLLLKSCSVGNRDVLGARLDWTWVCDARLGGTRTGRQ